MSAIASGIKNTEERSAARPPAVAGSFYPGQRDRLLRTVEKLVDSVPAGLSGTTRAVIAPHAGYACSGIVAAAVFKTLQQYAHRKMTVYLMGPAHWLPVHGVGVYTGRAFASPLGEVEVAQEAVQTLLRSDSFCSPAPEAHGPEHCLEVELPFLQIVMDSFAIVPMLLDAEADPARLARALVKIAGQDPNALIVASSDLSHYRPYAEAYAVDRALLAALLAGDRTAVAKGEACGLQGILVLMAMAASLGWKARQVAYLNSGDTCGPRGNVVGYGGVVFEEPVRSIPEIHCTPQQPSAIP